MINWRNSLKSFECGSCACGLAILSMFILAMVLASYFVLISQNKDVEKLTAAVSGLVKLLVSSGLFAGFMSWLSGRKAEREAETKE
jgi:hypothetical protein